MYSYNNIFYSFSYSFHLNVLRHEQVQFVAIMVHAFQLLFIDCNYPKAFVWWIGMHAVMFLFLFNEFYQATYKAKQDRVSALHQKY